ncbi:MAG: hypothetical protein KAJ51_05300, partial [Thermoplasmata archaeon]|nr:hypothetical protein [Thermoplasmata archaeon]
MNNINGFVFYIEVYGNIFKGVRNDSNIYPDILCIFIDSDSNPKTGYSTMGVGLGAEYLIDIRGAEGLIIQSRLYEYYPSNLSSLEDWSNWVYHSNIATGIDVYRLEGGVRLPDHSINREASNINLLITTQDFYGNQDISDCILSTNQVMLTAKINSELRDVVSTNEEQEVFMTVELSAQQTYSKEVGITGMEFERLGTIQDDDVENLKVIVYEGKPKPNFDELRHYINNYEPECEISVAGNSNERMALDDGTLNGTNFGSNQISMNTSLQESIQSNYTILKAQNEFKNGHNNLIFDSPIIIEPDREMTLVVTMDIANSAASESSIGLKLKELQTINATPTLIRSGQKLAYINKIPESIKIDGAFGDWENCREKIVSKDKDANRIPNPDIDIQEVAQVNNDKKLDL